MRLVEIVIGVAVAATRGEATESSRCRNDSVPRRPLCDIGFCRRIREAGDLARGEPAVGGAHARVNAILRRSTSAAECDDNAGRSDAPRHEHTATVARQTSDD